jgi:hypothetical protein
VDVHFLEDVRVVGRQLDRHSLCEGLEICNLPEREFASLLVHADDEVPEVVQLLLPDPRWGCTFFYGQCVSVVTQFREVIVTRAQAQEGVAGPGLQFQEDPGAPPHRDLRRLQVEAEAARVLGDNLVAEEGVVLLQVEARSGGCEEKEGQNQ